MPRRPREALGGLAYDVLTCGVGRMELFGDEADCRALERVLAAAVERRRIRGQAESDDADIALEMTA